MPALVLYRLLTEARRLHSTGRRSDGRPVDPALAAKLPGLISDLRVRLYRA